MVNTSDNQPPKKNAGFAKYAAVRLTTTILFIIFAVWVLGSIPESVGQDKQTTSSHIARITGHDQKDHGTPPSAGKLSSKTGHAEDGHNTGNASHHHPDDPGAEATTHTDTSHQTGNAMEKTPSAGEEKSDHSGKTDDHTIHRSHDSPAEKGHGDQKSGHAVRPTGVAFVEATIKPLDYELNHRFWGWRPNDIVNLTDNVDNFQLGVLEVTRRTTVLLAERISRTGTTDAFNPHLENAMNWLMVKASRYWFPAPETKYKESIMELESYKQALIDGSATFYTRTDNFIPLLSSYEDLLGSCDENLVKQRHNDGSKVSLFEADDYFYYAKGVANTLASILEAIHHDFHNTLESRHAAELLHHALESCRQAAALDPLFITNGDLDGIFANHRANMAAPISHARFYISQLIKTLST
jgi:hypothetical protein